MNTEFLEDFKAAIKMAEDELKTGFDDPEVVEDDYREIEDEFNSVWEDR